MRVALVSPLFESVPPRLYGGTERVVYNLANGLEAAGAEVTLFASGDSRVNCPLVPMIDEALRLSTRSVRDPNAYHFRMLAEVARRSHEFDVIHNHHDHWMLPLTEMTSTPMVTTLHGRLDVPELCLGLRAYPKARFISISRSQRSFAPDLDWAGTIHHGLDVEKHRFYARPGKYLAFLGRISREKRPDLAIEIAQRAGIPLKIAAKIEGEEMQSYYDHLIKPHVDGRNVEFIGEICDAERDEFLGEALALAFPIDWPEPFGLVVIESMACGTPVLARNCGAVPELVEDGLTGFCHSDIRVLARRARELPSIDRALCRKRAEERFSLTRMTEDYLNVYRTLSEPAERKHARDLSDLRPRRGERRRGERALRPRLDRHRRHFVHPHQRLADGDT